jgi:Xaa-Pro aminopeptidase
MDYGVILGGYVSDMTRTFHTGSVPRRARQVYEAVLEAQLAAIAAVRPGAVCSSVDAAARKVLQREGLGEAFSHSTGHGLGLEVHEAPRVSRLSKQRLQPGHVITIEPGVYIPGWGGVRIEDVVLVTETGVEVLTPTTKKLLSV